MFSILVLTDFSEAATYSASYACVLARQLRCRKISFYHAYQQTIHSSQTIILESDEKGLEQEAINKLHALGDSLKEMIPAETVVEYLADTRGLEHVNDITEDVHAELIVMGTTGKTKLEKMLVGSHAMMVCKNSRVPVVLVPPRICMDPVQHIVFACDYKELEETLPVSNIKKLLDGFHLPLSVVKISRQQGEIPEENSPGAAVLKDTLDQYAPDYHCVQNGETVSGILEFANTHKASLILLMARKYNFAAGLFHRSVTEQLAYETPIPLLVLQQKESKEINVQ